MLWLTLFCLAFAGAADMISGIFRSIIWSQTIPDHLRGRLAGIEMLSYTTGPLLGQLRSGLMARTRLGIGGSIWVGGVLCIAGTVALAAALPRFLAYNGRDGIARKQAEDEAWAASAAARTTAA
jgi:MFS family permease